jgi:RecA-family ATPase
MPTVVPFPLQPPPRPTPYQLGDLSEFRPLAPLVAMPRWVTWTYEWNGTKWTKEPHGKGGTPRWGEPRYWMTHTQAVMQMQAKGHDGVGFVLGPEGKVMCEIAGIDLDNCLGYDNRDRRTMSAWAAAIIDKAQAKGAYTEVTVSDAGMRVIGITTRQVSIDCNCKGEELPDGSLRIIRGEKSGPGFEIYCRPANRYITMSGIDGQGSPLVPIDDIIDEVLQCHPQREKAAAVASEPDWKLRPGEDPDPVDDELMARITGPLDKHDADDKSAAFYGVVSELLYANHNINDIVKLMDDKTNGVAQRYIKENRLPKMVESSFNKIRTEFYGLTPEFLRQPQKPTAAQSSQTGQQGPQRAQKPAGGLKVINIGELLKNPAPLQPWVVPKWLPDETLTLLAGDGGSGKSMLMLMLCMARAAGAMWMGFQLVKGNTLYLSAEDPEDDIHRRTERIAAHMNLQPGTLDGFKVVDFTIEDETEVVSPVRVGRETKLQVTVVLEKIEQLAVEYKAGLVVFDANSDFFGGDEINRREVKMFTKLLRRRAEKLKIAIVLIAHPSVEGMNSGRGYSGSTQWNNGPRARWKFGKMPKDNGTEADSDVRVLELAKANKGRDGEKIHMRWVDGILIKVEPGATANPANAEHAERVFLELLAKRNAQGRYVSHKNGPNSAPVVLAEEPKGKEVGKEALRAAMGRLFDKNLIQIVPYGKKSNPHERIEITHHNTGSNSNGQTG